MPDSKYIELPVYGEDAHFSVDLALGKAKFACALDVCHGVCCTMPADAGAPILESEIAELERVFPIVKKYLSEESLATIAKEGMWKREADGSLTIPAIRGRDCVFVTYDENPPSFDKSKGSEERIALCAIEKAHRAHEIEGFPKPISCHLFPIRIYPNSENKYEIVYEEISECKGGRARGKREKIPLLNFLDSPLVRALGEERIERLRAAVLER
ncbi:MAG TPA: DUF3109 family protein [Candidatus Kapabacteria bacterium]|nr:DUF3109 family protein [Candidatus Kapabacteria bacterium]